MFRANRTEIKSATNGTGFNFNNSQWTGLFKRPSGLFKSFALSFLMFVLPGLSISSASAQDSGWYPKITQDLGLKRSFVYSSLYTTHYDPEPDHVNDQNMLGFEVETGEANVYGLSVFDNSFGQKSEYLYLGKKWHNFSSERFYTKLTGGLLHGYKEPYEDKIPLNDLGVAPALVPTLGYQHKKFAVEFSQLGLAAALVTAGYRF